MISVQTKNLSWQRSAVMQKSPAVFFDKDGTLIENIPYNVNPELIKILEGADKCLRLLIELGYKIFIVSNQSGVARGFFAELDLVKVWEKLDELTGIKFDGFYYCPHHPAGKIDGYNFVCECRKPETGLILQAAEENNINLENSWLIGDTESDIEAGKKAGCRTILICRNDKSYNDKSYLETPSIQQLHFQTENLLKAAEIILQNT